MIALATPAPYVVASRARVAALAADRVAALRADAAASGAWVATERDRNRRTARGARPARRAR